MRFLFSRASKNNKPEALASGLSILPSRDCLLGDVDDLIAARTYAQQLHRTADNLLQLLDVALYLLRQLIKGLAAGDVLGESVELLINRLAVFQICEVCRELLDALTLVVICYADLQLRQATQRVDLVDNHFGQTVYANSIACDNRLEPAGTARTAGNSTELCILHGC